MRTCTICQHLKRPDVDRRLAAGEPTAQVARAYELNHSSLHRHRVNCLKLASSNVIMKEAARGTAAVELLPSKEALGRAYFELRDRIDEIVRQAQDQGSLNVAIAGLNSVRHTLDNQNRPTKKRARRCCSLKSLGMSFRWLCAPRQTEAARGCRPIERRPAPNGKMLLCHGWRKRTPSRSSLDQMTRQLSLSVPSLSSSKEK